MTTLADLTARTPGLPCRDDPEPWFSTSAADRQYAARQCHHCPLLLDCQLYALKADERHGVWGGVDFEARAAGCGTERGYANHKRQQETACPLCQAAHDEAVEANRRRILAREHAAGGTLRGYWMHRRLGEEACVACKRACARQSQERRDKARAAAERPVTDLGDRRATEPLPSPQTAVQPLALAG
ncbi:WhiB family transcriptional regulator [Streptomyces sp. NPDC004135]